MATTKTCSKCQRVKSVIDFCKDSGYKDGRRSDCNACRRVDRVINANDMRPKPVTVTLPAALGHVPYVRAIEEKELPAPDQLPAAYLKRCADYWTDLLGEGTVATRIV